MWGIDSHVGEPSGRAVCLPEVQRSGDRSRRESSEPVGAFGGLCLAARRALAAARFRFANASGAGFTRVFLARVFLARCRVARRRVAVDCPERPRIPIGAPYDDVDFRTADR